jgi:hypothetical protein
VPTANMQTGEVTFGGVGSGLYSMLLFAILGVFLSCLMVGRTPEFLGKKIESREVKLTVIGTIGVPMLVLALSAVAIATRYGQASIFDSGRRAGRRRSTPTRPRRTTTAPRSPATPATSSLSPGTSAPTGSPSPTCWAARRWCSRASSRSSSRSPSPAR